MSVGTDRVRVSFNPSAESVVDKIKQLTADLIDLCETLIPDDGRVNRLDQLTEIVRLVTLAQDAYESAAMWAVKAATAKKP